MAGALDPREAENFGPYEVLERLGIGGMATVHRAKKRGPEGFEQTVALKRMLAHLAEDPSFVESFVREAKVASMLVHPNIAQVYDFGRIRGIYYIVMELVQGFDVRKLLRYASRANEAIPLPVVMTVLGELCDALDHAHNFVDEQGNRLDIVHRDISPSNLIVAQTGHLKVIDFGIAKASSRQLHTESGKVKGKLGYMSPEAALGLNSGPVSDMFSMGVVAWELITASPLFTTRTDMETMQRIREGTIAPPSHHNPFCPPELDQLILAALEREPRSRLSSAAAFRAGLDDICQRNGIATSARSVVEWVGKFAQPSDHWPRLSAREKPPTNREPTPPAAPRTSSVGDSTALIRGSRRPNTPSRPPQLRRSAEHVALASEIWGEDLSVAPPGPDFSIADMSPSTPQLGPTSVPSNPQIDAQLRASGAATHGSVVSLPLAQSARMSALPLQPSPRHSTPPPGTYDPRSPRSPSQPLSAPLPSGHHSQPLPAYSQPLLAYDSRQHSQPHYVQPPSTTTTRRSKLPILVLGLLFAVAGVLIAILVGRGGDDDPKLAALDMPALLPPDASPTTAEPIVAAAGPKAAIERDPVTRDANVTEPTRKPPKPITNRKPDRPTRPTRPEPPEQPTITEKPPEKPENPAEKPLVTEKPPEKPLVKPLVPDKPKPTRTPVVAGSAVTKLSGEVPALRGNAGDADMITAKICIDDSGRVTGVTSKTSPDMLAELQRGIASWRYKPYLRDGKPSAVCFPFTIKLIKR